MGMLLVGRRKLTPSRQLAKAMAEDAGTTRERTYWFQLKLCGARVTQVSAVHLIAPASSSSQLFTVTSLVRRPNHLGESKRKSGSLTLSDVDARPEVSGSPLRPSLSLLPDTRG